MHYKNWHYFLLIWNPNLKKNIFRNENLCSYENSIELCQIGIQILTKSAKFFFEKFLEIKNFQNFKYFELKLLICIFIKSINNEIVSELTKDKIY